MGRNKSINRLYLAVTVIYISVSLGIGTLANWLPFLSGMPVWASILLSQSLICVPGLLYCRRKGIALGELIPHRRLNVATIVLVVVCTYLMYPMIVVLNAISMLFTSSGTAAVSDMMQGQGFALSVLLIAMLPAVVEEFMFRGLLFQTYKKSRLLPAVLLSAFLFGCMHMNLNQFMYAFALGVYLAFLVEATGSIFSSMLAHFTLNVTSVALSYLLPMLERMAGSAPGQAQQQIPQGGFAAVMEGSELVMFLFGVMIWGVIAIGTTCGAVGVYIAICKINGRWGYARQMFRGGDRERMVTFALVAAVILSFAMMGMYILLEWI